MNNESLARRLTECEILCSFLKKDVSEFCIKGGNQPDKKIIRGLLRKMSCSNIDLTAPTDCQALDCTFDYEYQRYDGIISYEFVSNIIPLYANSNIAKRTFFVTSGMGAISSLIISLFSYDNYDIRYSPDIYYETAWMLDLFNKKEGTVIYYIDSIQCNPLDTYYDIPNGANSQIAIVDTTCWSFEQSERVIKDILCKCGLCIALRSHTKLDMLGTEYSKLGSITYYTSKLANNDLITVFKKIIYNHMSFIGHLGLWATPDAIPIFWKDPSFIQVSDNRIAALRSVNRYAADVLSDNPKIPFTLPEHSLFVLLKIAEIRSDQINCFKELLNDYITKEQLKGTPVRRAAGFGFDDTVIDLYYDYKSKRNILRIAYGDIPIEIVRKITLDLQEKIYDFQNRYYSSN